MGLEICVRIKIIVEAYIYFLLTVFSSSDNFSWTLTPSWFDLGVSGTVSASLSLSDASVLVLVISGKATSSSSSFWLLALLSVSGLTEVDDLLRELGFMSLSSISNWERTGFPRFCCLPFPLYSVSCSRGFVSSSTISDGLKAWIF